MNYNQNSNKTILNFSYGQRRSEFRESISLKRTACTFHKQDGASTKIQEKNQSELSSSGKLTFISSQRANWMFVEPRILGNPIIPKGTYAGKDSFTC